jgi:hypothetical protein
MTMPRTTILVLSLLPGCGYPFDILYDGPDGPGLDSLEGTRTAPPTSQGDEGTDDSAAADSSTTGGATTDGATTDSVTSETTATTGPGEDMCVPPQLECPAPAAEDCATDLVDENCDGDSICPGEPLAGRDFAGTNDIILGVEVGPSGDVLLLGFSEDSVDFGGVCEPVSGAFIARFERETLECETVLALPEEFTVDDLAVEEDCSVVVVGGTLGSAAALRLTGDWTHAIDVVTAANGTEITAVAIDDGISVVGLCEGGMWVADLDADLGVSADDCVVGATSRDIARRGGAVAVTGYYYEDSVFGAVNLMSRDADDGSTDVFVAVFASGTDIQWTAAEGMGGESSDYGYGVAIGANGDVFVTGLVDSAMFLPFGTGPALDCEDCLGYDAFVAALDADLVHKQTVRYGTNNNQIGSAIAVDAAGSVLVSGGFKTNIKIGQETILSHPTDTYAVFHAKLDPADLELSYWQREVDGMVDNFMAVDMLGSIIVSEDDETIYIRPFSP